MYTGHSCTCLPTYISDRSFNVKITKITLNENGSLCMLTLTSSHVGIIKQLSVTVMLPIEISHNKYQISQPNCSHNWLNIKCLFCSGEAICKERKIGTCHFVDFITKFESFYIQFLSQKCGGIKLFFLKRIDSREPQYGKSLYQ